MTYAPWLGRKMMLFVGITALCLGSAIGWFATTKEWPVMIILLLGGVGVFVANRAKIGIPGWLLLLASVSPAVQLVSGLPKLRGEEMILPVVVTMLLLRPQRPSDAVWRNPVMLGFFLFGLSTLFSINWGSFQLGVPLSWRDMLELVKYGKYALIFGITYAFPFDTHGARRMFFTFLVAIFIVDLVALLQYLDLFGINSWLSPVYASTQLAGLQVSESFQRRVTGTLTNPNVLAMFCAVIEAYLIAALLEALASPFVLVPLFMLNSVAIMMTVSREGIVLLVQAFLLLLFQARGRGQSVLKRLVLLCGIIAVVVVGFSFFSNNSVYFKNRMQELLTPQQAGSLRSRLDYKWPIVWALVQESPIFGHGTAKNVLDWVVDSEYLLVLYRYGFVGFLLYYGLMAYATWRVLKVNIRQLINPYAQLWVVGARLFMLLTWTINIISSTLYELQLASILWWTCGAALNLASRDGDGVYGETTRPSHSQLVPTSGRGGGA